MSQLQLPFDLQGNRCNGVSVSVRILEVGACKDSTMASDRPPTSIELFAGGGGMALGLHQAGFHHAALVEWDSKACDTLRLNAAGRWSQDDIWEGDVRAWLQAPLRKVAEGASRA